MKAMFTTVVSLIIVSSGSAAEEEDDGKVVAESQFYFDMEGWSTKGKCEDLAHEAKMVRGSDKGKGMWFYAAPSKFLGNKGVLHGGKLQYKLGFFEYNSEGEDFVQDYDVVMISSVHSLKLGVKGLIEAWKFSNEVTVNFNVEQGWAVMSTGKAASEKELTNVLSTLSGLYIRGAYYVGHETNYLQEVRLKIPPGIAVPPDMLSPDSRPDDAQDSNALFEHDENVPVKEQPPVRQDPEPAASGETKQYKASIDETGLDALAAKLATALFDPIQRRIEGDGGMMALTAKELGFADKDGVKKVDLTKVSTVTTGKDGAIHVMGKDSETPLLVAPTLPPSPSRSSEISSRRCEP